jgi:hypothetical protein
MIRSLPRAALLLFLLGLSGPASAQIRRIPLHPPFPPEKTRTAAVVYTRSYFEERYAGRSMAASLGSPIALLMRGATSPSRDRTARLESGRFERHLGDFDVAAYVSSHLSDGLAATRFLDLRFAADAPAADEMAARAPAEKAGDHPFFDRLAADGNALFLPLRLSYGIAQRKGGEQFGFRKVYRPYLRVLGKLVSVSDRKVLWQDELIAFGEIPYKSVKADPENISRDELVSTFQALTGKLADLLRRTLDGEGIADRATFGLTLREDERF